AAALLAVGAPHGSPARAASALALGPPLPAARSGPARLRAPAARAASAPRDPGGARADRAPPGVRGRRGRSPAAVGILAAGAPPPRLRDGSPGDGARARGARALPDRRRRPEAARGLSIAGVGHGARHDRAARRGHGKGARGD